MESMSSIMKKMEQVPESGLYNKSVINESSEGRKHLVDNSNSIANHLRAFQDVLGENAFNKPAAPTQQNLTEENTMKMIGGLQVVKELLEGDLTKEPQAILERVKTILGSF